MNIKEHSGELKKGYKPRSIKEEDTANLISRLQKHESTFSGGLGKEDAVIPDVERALRQTQYSFSLGYVTAAREWRGRWLNCWMNVFPR